MSRFKVKDRVSWVDHLLNFWTGRSRKVTSVGTVYRIDRTRVAVLPDEWKAEGKRTGLLRRPSELTRLPV